MVGLFLTLLTLICPGDANGDRIVNVLDLSVQAAYYLQTVEPGTHGDVTGDGVVNILDLVLVSHNYGRICVTAPGLAND